MKNITCYVKLKRNAELLTEDVYVKDMGGVWCADSALTSKVKSVKVYKFGKNETQKVVSILEIIARIGEICPDIVVESLGSNETLIEIVEEDVPGRMKDKAKVVFVCLISFFGTAFTIMAYHNDIDIINFFDGFYESVLGATPQGVTALEIAYSIGLSLGIIIFFNHVGNKRLTKDPTPIEVEMRVYEQDVDNAIIEQAEREGTTLDVD